MVLLQEALSLPSPPSSTSHIGGLPLPQRLDFALDRELDDARVLVIEPWTHVGGMLAAGMVDDSIKGEAPRYFDFQFQLSAVAGRTEAYGGLAAELFRRIASALGHPHNASCGCFQANPNTTEQVFLAWLHEEGIDVIANASLVDTTIANTTITSICLSNGAIVTGSYFMDGTYEGDLVAGIGHPFDVGMESQSLYNESFAGHGLCEGDRSTGWQSFNVDVAPFDANGVLLPHVTATNITPGSASSTIQSFNFRACLTTDNGVTIPLPLRYNPSEWQLLDRFIVATQKAGKNISPSTFFGCSSLAGGCDTNDGPAVSINPMGHGTCFSRFC
jgi:hypothetical protein